MAAMAAMAAQACFVMAPGLQLHNGNKVSSVLLEPSGCFLLICGQ